MEKVNNYHPNQLLSSPETARVLGLKVTNRDWKNLRKKLIAEYGMTNIPGIGFKIRYKNLEKFLSEQYG